MAGRGAAGCISLTGTRGLSLAYHLRHGSHGAVDTPGTGAEQDHGDQTKDGGGQHDAVESECKLGHPQRHAVSMIRMVPGKAEGPQDRHYLFQARGTPEHQPGIKQHLAEHEQEEDQETVTEPFGFHPARNRTAWRKVKLAPKYGKQLSPAAVTVAVEFGSCYYGDCQGDQEADQAQPCKHDIEKAKDQIGEGCDPQVVVPVAGIFFCIFIVHGVRLLFPDWRK